MKNLFIFASPDKCFSNKYAVSKKYFDYATLIRLQIDNSYRLGWKKEDIILMTNFEYEYNGIKSIVISDNYFCNIKKRSGSTKTVATAYLLENGLLKDDEIYWSHDFDAYQNNVIKEDELGLDNYDAGFTTYGWSPKWCLGSYFFKLSAKDIFRDIKDTIYEIQNEDERALVKLTKENKNGFNAKIKTLNITYQIGMRNVESNYEKADKPLKVVHFHPYYLDNAMPDIPLNIFMYGKNKLGIPLMSQGLIELFHQYEIK